jgi:hypothetical protein
MYEQGLGVPQDYVGAHIWYNLVAHYIPGLLDEHALTLRDEVAAKMTPEQIAEAVTSRGTLGVADGMIDSAIGACAIRLPDPNRANQPIRIRWA